ncbi:MAG TPA: Fe-Mn family superoxide dismutase [Candidatus Paceibacterota bacterium]|nr:Fe-Mn family superoxide dismutase [Candidatus Paceibacterota bacterium]
MSPYGPKTFTIPALDGISPKSIEEHLGLYQGYVKNFMGMCTLIGELLVDPAKNAHALAELQRRLSFEFDGMRLHEYYFTQLEGGAKALDTSSAFAAAFAKQYGSIDALVPMMKNVGLMRGPGWAILYYDTEAGIFQAAFVGEQHQGHFVGLPVILALDVWEHAFILDYGAQGKGNYIDAFFKNLNWGVVENRFASAQG